MKLRNRGQGAMEYLMTYGWAILVVMIVGIVMWQLGIFNLGQTTATTAKGFSRIKPMLTGAECHGTGAVANDCSFQFTNGAGGSITVTAATLGGVGAADMSVNNAAYAAVGAQTVSAGTSFRLRNAANAEACSAPTQGDPYACDITIDYTINSAGTAVAHVDRGTIQGPRD